VKTVLLEALVVAAVGAVLAFAANALSPRGLRLSRDYFPASLQKTNAGPSVQSGTTNKVSAAELLAARVKELGFQLLDTPGARQWHNDPAYQQSQTIFIDARDGEQYQEGHIPGAYEFDYYHPEAQLSTVLPLCQIAQRVLVYCHGGDCEDSILAAVFLRDAGQVPAGKFAIYGGGFTEWSTNNLPVETGLRGSGLLRATASPPGK
jgi:rhodanese-related sulfurtransferase